MLAILTKRVEGFFRWWAAELLGCLPEGLRALIGSKRRRLVVTLAPSQVTFERTKGDQLVPVGQVSLSQPETAEQTRQVRSLLSSIESTVSEVILRLGAGQVLVRRVVLPAAAEDNLREVLAFEMDRNTPFRAEEVLYDSRVVERDSDLKTISVELIVVAKDTAQAAVDLLKTWGLEPDRLEPSTPTGSDRPLNLLSRQPRVVRGRMRRTVSYGAALTVLILLILLVNLPLAQKREQLAQLEKELSEVRSEALWADQLRAEVKNALTRSRFIVELKRNRVPAIELLEEVTEQLPDNTWLLHFAYQNDRLSMAGYSSKPTDLIGLLERSPELEQVAFTSPVTMDLRVGKERFNLSAEVPMRAEP